MELAISGVTTFPCMYAFWGEQCWDWRKNLGKETLFVVAYLIKQVLCFPADIKSVDVVQLHQWVKIENDRRVVH
jgi:hypothetical protein